MKFLKIGYFADGPWSHEALIKLLNDDSIKILFICARYDNPDPILKELSTKYHIDYLVHENVNSREFINLMTQYNSDLQVSMSFNQIFKNELINLAPLKTINCHAGKLPYYRGRNILNWALINNESEFGITVHYVDEGIDTGDIILQKTYPIYEHDDYGTLLKRSYQYCADNLFESIKIIQSGNIKTIPQKEIHPLGFYCVARKMGDERLNWNQTSREIFNFTRALSSPGPQASTFLDGFELKINKIEYSVDAPIYKGVEGSIVGVESRAFYVKTSDSFIKVIDWSGRRQPKIGDRLK